MSRLLALYFLSLLITSSLRACAAHTVVLSGNRIVTDGYRGQVLYRSSGDLNGDGKNETVFCIDPATHRSQPYILVAKKSAGRWRVIASQDLGYFRLRADVSDVNGDKKAEIIARGLSGDGHGWCDILTLKNEKLKNLGNFNATKLKDLDGDGIPEVMSRAWTVFGFIGDRWLTIYKWNGKGYTDVSARFPKAYDAVIADIRQVIHDLRYTDKFGDHFNLQRYPELFAGLYYYLGKAYESRGIPQKAKTQYAIAYRLEPTEAQYADAFRGTWKIKSKMKQEGQDF